jgi:hypothetical protein
MALSRLATDIDRLVDTHGAASLIEQLVARIGIDAIRAEVRRYKIEPRRRRGRTEQELFEVWLAIELERAKARSSDGRDVTQVCRKMKRFTWIAARGGQYNIARVIDSPEALLRLYQQACNRLKSRQAERRAWEGYRDAIVSQQRPRASQRRARRAT